MNDWRAERGDLGATLSVTRVLSDSLLRHAPAKLNNDAETMEILI